MAAILCRVCFVEPCKAMAKCCEGCCECLGSCCQCFGDCLNSCCSGFERCCDYISLCCDKPFSGCLFTSLLINFVALLYGIFAIVSGGNQCNKPLLVLGILAIICTVINALFSYYMYRTVNGDEDNPLFSNNNDQEMKPSAKLYEFFKYDKWMACYIIFVVILIAILITNVTLAGGCQSDIGQGVFWVSIILFIYLGIATLILFSYVAFDAFKEWASGCCCWFIPICWPCLLIGCCLNLADDMNKSLVPKNKNKNKSNTSNNGRSNNYTVPSEQNKTNQYQQPVAAQQPVIVVQQPVQIQPVQPQPQPVVYAQPPPQQTQVVVTQPQPIQPYNTSGSGYNPQAPVGIQSAQPGVLVMHQQQPQQAQTTGYTDPNTVSYGQPQQEVQDDNKNDEEQVDYDELKKKGKEVAAAAGKQAKKAGVKALGWMAKKMNELNDKVQDDPAKAAPAEGEGGGGNQKTY